MKRRELFAITPGLFFLSCSNDSPKTVEKHPEPMTGLHALYQMYTFARTWAQDLKVLRLTSIAIPEMKAANGKAAAWQVLFASEALAKARTYTFSIYDESVTLRKGIFGEAISALPSGIRAFELGEANTDSDKAWEIALEHGKKYAGENPDMAVSYVLESQRASDPPVWRVMWGARAAASNFSVLVDAHAGSYIRTLT